MNLFLQQVNLFLDATMEFASSATGSKGGMKIYILYGVYGYPHDGSHPALLFYGLVTSTDEYIWTMLPII